jgi:DNA repair exonuclease SbcCD nuclease subunit
MIKINKPKVAIVSDLHLGVHTNSAQWHDIALNWAKWFSAELKRQNVKDIIFCGDWYHNRSEISVSTLQVSADVLKILEDFNIIALVGNHDIFYKHRTDVNSLSLFKNSRNISVVDKVTSINVFDKVITLCPWGTGVNQIEKSDIVFGHFEIETFKMNSYKDCEDGLSVKELLKRSSLIISGHFHFRHEKRFGAGTILYVGNPFQMDFGDCDNTKGYYLLDIDTQEYEFYENTISPHYKKIHLSELVEAETITSEIKTAFANNIVKFKIDKNISQEDLAILTSKLNLLKPESLHIEYDLSYNKISNESSERDLSGIDIPCAIEEFINLLEIDDKSNILEYTLDLYNKCIA